MTESNYKKEPSPDQEQAASLGQSVQVRQQGTQIDTPAVHPFLPQTQQMEEQLLSLIVQNEGKNLEQVRDIVSPKDFNNQEAATLYELILKMANKGCAIDIVNVDAEARKEKQEIPLQSLIYWMTQVIGISSHGELDLAYRLAEKKRRKVLLSNLYKLQCGIINGTDTDMQTASQAMREMADDFALWDNRNLDISSIDDLLSKNVPEPSYVVDRLVVENGVNMISGQTGAMKSYIGLHMAIQIAKGEKVFSTFNTKQMGVLIVDDENGEPLLKKRMLQLSLGRGLPLHYICYPEPRLSFEIENVKLLIRECQQRGVGFVIFDAYVRFLAERDENTANDTSVVNRNLKEFSKADITVMSQHHHGKGRENGHNGNQAVRGSSDIPAGLNSHIVVRKNGDILTLKQPKLREDQPVKPFNLAVVTDNSNLSFEYLGGEKTTASKLEQACQAIISLLKEKKELLYTKQIIDHLQNECRIGESTTSKAIESLAAQKKIIRDPVKHEKNRVYYTLAIQP